MVKAMQVLESDTSPDFSP